MQPENKKECAVTHSSRKQRMRLIGIEPTHAAPEATALSTELQTHLCHDTPFYWKLQGFYFAEFDEGHCFLDVILIK